MALLIQLVVGGILGWLAGLILGKDLPGGVIGNIVAGILGSMIGGNLFSNFGPQVAGFAIIPTILGAIILILVVSFILKSTR